MSPTDRFQLRTLNILHILNDGYYASLLLFLPFLTKEFGLTLVQAGLLGTVLNSLGLVCTLPSGRLAARFGGMQILILCAILYGAGYVGTSFADSYLWLFPAFIIAGIAFGLFHAIAFALVTRLSTPAVRGRNMGNFTAIGDIGKMGISSILTFIIVYTGWRFSALTYGIIALITGLFFLLLLRRKSDPTVKAEKSMTLPRLQDVLSHAPLIFASLTSFFDVFASSSFFVFLPFLLLTRGIDPALLGTFASVFFLGNLSGKLILGRFADRFPSVLIVIASELLMALCIVVLAISTSIPIILLCSVIAGIFTKGTVPVIQTMVAEASDHHGHFEQSFAVSGFLNAVAMTASPVVLGFISDKQGIVSSFYTMACITVIAVIPALLFGYTQRRTSPA